LAPDMVLGPKQLTGRCENDADPGSVAFASEEVMSYPLSNKWRFISQFRFIIYPWPSNSAVGEPYAHIEARTRPEKLPAYPGLGFDGVRLALLFAQNHSSTVFNYDVP
jgi:hypothetical protein